MTTPRLEIRLDQVRHNASVLVGRLARRGIGVTGVTKATLGSPEVARELLVAGVASIGESRVENIEALRAAGVAAPVTLIRSPMLSQVDRVVAHAEVSLNTELDVVVALSAAAGEQRRPHGVVLMVELGDLREGILAADLVAVVGRALRLPHIVVRGIGTNLACQSGVTPDEENTAELSQLVGSLEARFGVTFDIVSGGNSATLDWALGSPDVGRVTDLRLGESILLGREPLERQPIEGLHTDAFTLVAEVIESKIKPGQPWGSRGETAFGPAGACPDERVPGDAGVDLADGEETSRVILALGRQDVDPDGLVAPDGLKILGASSDHLVLDAGAARPAVGAEVRFGLGYRALLAAMTSPFVTRSFTGASDPQAETTCRPLSI